MAVHSDTSYRNKNRNNYCYTNYNTELHLQNTSQDFPFFSAKRSKSQQQKEKILDNHIASIIGQFREWKNLPITIRIGHDDSEFSNPIELIIQKVDLNTFSTNKIQINVIGSVLPILNEHNPYGDTIEEWALSHLKEYTKTYDIYSQVLICQENFNIKIKNFINKVKQQLNLVTNSDDETKNELLTRFYLYKIVDEMKNSTPDKYRLRHFDMVKISDEEIIYNPFPDKEKDIIKDLELRYNEISREIKMFRDTINSLNQLIAEFQQSLRTIIDGSILGLKGSCNVEKQLNKSRIKSLFNRH